MSPVLTHIEYAPLIMLLFFVYNLRRILEWPLGTSRPCRTCARNNFLIGHAMDIG